MVSSAQVVFAHSVEGLFVGALGGEAPPARSERCAAWASTSRRSYCPPAPTDFRLTFNEAGISRWVSQGLLRAGLAFAGAKECTVEVVTFTGTDVVYRITWK